jgi:hypothetical protein
MKYLHKYETVTAFTQDYNGTGYTEPWVSYTVENEGINYNKDVIDFRPTGQFRLSDFDITPEIMDHWAEVISESQPYANLGILVMSESVNYAELGSGTFYFENGSGYWTFVNPSGDYVEIGYGDNVK